MKSKILIIEDDECFVGAIRTILKKYEVEIVWAPTGSDGIKVYRENIHGFATVIIDNGLPNNISGSQISQVIRKLNDVQDILFTSGIHGESNLIDLLEAGGARTFLYKRRDPQEHLTKILDSIAIYQYKNRVIGFDNYEPERAELELGTAGLAGRSKESYLIFQKSKKYSTSSYPLLIVGESGVGKELIANLIAGEKNMTSINCARYEHSENLLEAELFGYVKGAFTGAIANNPGLLAAADGQVVFFDELHRLSLSAQAKLLRFLQEMKFRRVGQNSGPEIKIDFRIICAAKPVIFEMMKDGRFLDDLFHRVAHLKIKIPPLRERIEDIEPLIRRFQNEFNKDKPANLQKQFRISTIEDMKKHSWSGNVRQLQGAVRSMLTDARGDIVNPADFDEYLKSPGSTVIARGATLEDSTRIFQTAQIIEALKGSYTQAEAAFKLGETPSTFSKKLVRLGIDADAYLLQRPSKTVCV